MNKRYLIQSSITLAWGAAIVGLILFLLTFFVDTVPPESKTPLLLYRLRDQIVEYTADHHALPAPADGSLPSPFEATDSWGRKIHHSTEGDSVTLTSDGQDGPGGNSQIIGVFKIRTPQGNWISKYNQEWVVIPSLKSRS